MVSDCMSAGGVVRIFKVKVIVKHCQFIEILQNIIVPFMQDLLGKQQGVFHQDNDPRHTMKATKIRHPDNNFGHHCNYACQANHSSGFTVENAGLP